jgi:hypothetical protein
MTRRAGVSFPDEVFEQVEDHRLKTDPETGTRSIRERSPVIVNLVELGLVATEIIEDSDLELDWGRPRKAFVRQALLNELRREFDD